MYQISLTSIPEAAGFLNVSEAYVNKFIELGLVIPVRKKSETLLTKYNLRRLIQAVELYEKNFPPETIEFMLDS